MRNTDKFFSFCNLGGVFVEILQGEDHSRTAQMTEHVVETGRVISDHIILKPRMVTIRCEETNVPVSGESPKDTVRKIYNKLEIMWVKREPVKLYTTHFTYENMVLTNLSSLHNAPFKYKLNFIATFTQINKARISSGVIPDSEMKNKAQSEEVKTGTVGVTNTSIINFQ